MSKTPLDTTDIVSELKSGSVFFQKEERSQAEEEHPVPADRGVRDVPPVRPLPEREVIRHSFNIYRDQLQALKRLKSLYMMENGEEKGMSEMVRDAIDQYMESRS
jgi:hypothetical protein